MNQLKSVTHMHDKNGCSLTREHLKKENVILLFERWYFEAKKKQNTFYNIYPFLGAPAPIW